MKKVLIGCGIVFVMLIASAVIAVMYFGPKMKDWFEGQIAKEKERQELVNAWVPPVKDIKDAKELQALPDETVFPSKVGENNRVSADEITNIPDLKIDLKGKHATYKVGSDTVDVYIYAVTELEKEALFGRLQALYKEGEGQSGKRSITNFGYRSFLESPEQGQNHLWYLKGWLFVFRTKAADDKEAFVLDYFKAIDAKGKPEPKINEDGKKPTTDKKEVDKK